MSRTETITPRTVRSLPRLSLDPHQAEQTDDTIQLPDYLWRCPEDLSLIGDYEGAGMAWWADNAAFAEAHTLTNGLEAYEEGRETIWSMRELAESTWASLGQDDLLQAIQSVFGSDWHVGLIDRSIDTETLLEAIEVLTAVDLLDEERLADLPTWGPRGVLESTQDTDVLWSWDSSHVLITDSSGEWWLKERAVYSSREAQIALAQEVLRDSSESDERRDLAISWITYGQGEAEEPGERL
jgi:hypothetical protein